MERYPWYELADGKELISQGDLIESCPVIVPTTTISTQEISSEVSEYDVIIMSQSCDLIYQNINLVLVCPYWDFDEFEKDKDFFKSKEGRKALKRGNLPGYHLLNKCKIENYSTNFLVVDFRNVFGVPYDFLVKISQEKEKRIRLLPPYREHLSQAFARFFMRVGLPADISDF